MGAQLLKDPTTKIFYDKFQLKISPKKVLEILENRFENANKHGTNQHEKEDRKKAHTLYISEKVMNSVEEYLNEFGAFRENKSVFVQDAIVFYLEHKKKEMKQMLLDKASKL
ncbi:PZ8b [Helicobacter pylori Hp H-42]|uniref:PZ8b n=1 Tax=Helicobacter pylori Hp H-42 TaxID=992047 RepID=A0AB33XGY7_HELPX|nr:PZ8b [Helicobacter pylori Hp H-42]